MGSGPAVATSLIQAGVLLAVVLFGQVIAVRHLPVETIPSVLQGRVALCTRLRSWLMVTAITMAATGVALHLT
jgi:hypothetical protein